MKTPTHDIICKIFFDYINNETEILSIFFLLPCSPQHNHGLPCIVHAGSITQAGQRLPAPSSLVCLNPGKIACLALELACFSRAVFHPLDIQNYSQFLHQLPNSYGRVGKSGIFLLVGQGHSNESNCLGSNTQLGPHTRLHEVPVSITYVVVTAVASALGNN